MKTDLIQKMKYIETTYPVEDIEYKGLKIWPFLRAQIFSTYFFLDSDERLKPKTKFQMLIEALSMTSIRTILKKNAVVIFTDDVGVKKNNGEYIDRIMQGFFDFENKTIPIFIKLFSKKISPMKKYVNINFYSCFIYVINLFCPVRKKNILGLLILENIIRDLNINFDYLKSIKIIVSGIKLYNLYL